ncbi:MAG: retropepsin-like aspartic protease [Myxococcota bacterium]
MWKIASTLLFFSSVVAHAQIKPEEISPRAAAIKRGDFVAAAKLPARDDEEARFLEASVLLARHRIAEAEAIYEGLPRGTHTEAELAWLLAHARRDPQRSAAAAKALCARGDPTGRACVDEEFYAARVVRGAVQRHGPTKLRMAQGAPFPLVLGRVGQRHTGVIVDTGASQTVVSTRLAKELGLALSRRSFPIGVVAGSGVASAHLAILPELWLDKTQLTTVPVLVLDVPGLEENGIDIILAPHRDLQGLVVELDFPSHQLTLLEENAAARPNGLVLPYLHAGFDLVVEARVGEGPMALFSFDTGMDQGFAVSEDYASGLQQVRSSSQSAGAVLYGAQQSRELRKTPPLIVQLGSASMPPQEGLITPLLDGRVFRMSGMLGNALWRERVVVLDTVRHRISIHENTPLKSTPGEAAPQPR